MTGPAGVAVVECALKQGYRHPPVETHPSNLIRLKPA